MATGSTCPSSSSSPFPYYAALPPPSAPRRRDDHVGSGFIAGADVFSPLESPYSVETLGSAFSNLGLNSYVGRSPYNSLVDAHGVVNAGRRLSMNGHLGTDARGFYGHGSSDFDGSRSALYHNLADLYYRSLIANRDFAGSSSCSPHNLVYGGYGGSRLTLREFGSSRGLSYQSGMVDRPFLPKSSPIHSFQSHNHHRDLNHPVGSSRYSNGFVASDSSNFRSSRSKFELASGLISLTDLRGNVVRFAKDQNGCRILQARFDHDPKQEEIEMVLSEVIDDASDLMTHPFGNYLMQKLIDVCNEEQLSRLLVSLVRDNFQLISICCDIHGTRAVQTLLEKLTSPQQISEFMIALGPGAVEVIKDMNGYHVIQQCLKNFSPQQNMLLLNQIAKNCFEIATDKSGCCVLQQCIHHAEGGTRDRILSEIVAYAPQLAEDRYGNYVVQHVLGMNNSQWNVKIVERLKGCFISLSCNKFGSHVVERCLTKIGAKLSKWIIEFELLQSPKLAGLLLDPYGNFVIQAALSASQGDTRLHNGLVELIRKQSPSMSTNMYGRKVIEWFDRKGQPHVAGWESEGQNRKL